MIHADHDMMVQFEVVDPNHVGDDPLGNPPGNTAQEGGRSAVAVRTRGRPGG